MIESTKIDFPYRRIRQLDDSTELMEICHPGNRNQQYAAACIFFELKWADGLVPNLAGLEEKYGISRRILQRTRARLARLGLIEHVSYLNNRYGGRSGWKLACRFEAALRQLAEQVSHLRDRKGSDQEKERLLLTLADSRRAIVHQKEP